LRRRSTSRRVLVTIFVNASTTDRARLQLDAAIGVTAAVELGDVPSRIRALSP
jgi:hypothetical protein